MLLECLSDFLFRILCSSVPTIIAQIEYFVQASFKVCQNVIYCTYTWVHNPEQESNYWSVENIYLSTVLIAVHPNKLLKLYTMHLNLFTYLCTYILHQQA